MDERSSVSASEMSSGTRMGNRLRHQPNRILLVEDDPADQEAVRRCFEDKPVELEIVENGTELLDYFVGPQNAARKSPDIIILDLSMPGKSGNEVLADVRAAVGRWIPIVVFSSSDDFRDIIECYEAGCSTYITKPLDFADFESALHAIHHYWFKVAAA